MLVKQVQGGVFQSSGGIAPAHRERWRLRRIGRLCGDAGSAERGRVGQTHVAVVATDEDRRVASDGIDQLFGREFRRSPLGFVPVAAQNPRSLGRDFGALADAAGKFLGAGGIVQLHVVELRATGDEVHVRIVEAGQEEFASGIDRLASLGPRQALTSAFVPTATMRSPRIATACASGWRDRPSRCWRG